MLGVIVGPSAFVVLVVLAVLRRRRWPVWVGASLLGLLALSLWAYWEAIWRSFGYALDERHTPFRVQFVEYAALATSVLACSGLVISVCFAGASRPRAR